MLSKNELKYIQSLCHKKQRDETELFVAEGPKLAEELLQSDFEIVHVYATESFFKTHYNDHPSFKEISEIELNRMSSLQTPNQVLIVAKQKKTSNEIIFTDRITLVLDGIQDPGNIGTIIRIADWFGINSILCTDDCVDVYNPKVVQSTMGSICRVDVEYKDVAEVLQRVHVPVYGALLNGENIYDSRKVSEGILVIGNESKGIRETVRKFITHPVTIPKIGGAESLNAAVATGIIVGAFVNNK
jgi:TrmH family RNA methyltransferase